MIDKIDSIISGFIDDWKKTPYVWGNEIDIQVELAGRIKALLKTLGKEHLEAKYKGFKKKEKFNRLCCEPPIYYLENGVKRKCFPDIVVFADIPSFKNPPDENPQQNWPMLWVCEIKYETEWGGDFQKEHRNFDRKKLEALLEQVDGTKFACTLDFKRKMNTRKVSVKSRRLKAKRFMSCKIYSS